MGDKVILLDPTTGAAYRGGGAQDTAGNSLSVAAPSSGSGSALTRAKTTVAAGSLVIKGSAGNLYGFDAVSGASAGYVMIFDATVAPADGTVTPAHVEVLAANSGIARCFSVPIRFATGIVMVFSTTGPFTKTISATAFLAGDAA